MARRRHRGSRRAHMLPVREVTEEVWWTWDACSLPNSIDQTGEHLDSRGRAEPSRAAPRLSVWRTRTDSPADRRNARPTHMFGRYYMQRSRWTPLRKLEIRGHVAAPPTKTQIWRRASDALKITRLPLSTGPFWGGPNTRVQHHISASSSCLGISCSQYRRCSSVATSCVLTPSPSPRLPDCLFAEWILGDWLGAGCAPGTSREMQKLFFLFKGGRGRLAHGATLLRLHVVSPWTEGKRWAGGAVRLISKDNSLPPTQMDILTQFGMRARQSDQMVCGGGWTVKFKLRLQRLPRAARQATRQSAGFFFKRSPLTATGCWHLSVRR